MKSKKFAFAFLENVAFDSLAVAIYHAHSAAAPSLRDCSDRSSAKVYLRAFIIIDIFNHTHLSSSSIYLFMRICHHRYIYLCAFIIIPEKVQMT